MRGLTLVCMVVAVSQAMTTIIAPVQESSTSSSPSTATTTTNPLLQRRIDSEISRLTRLLQWRIRSLQRGAGRLDRSIMSLQRELGFNNAVLVNLPDLVKSILMSSPFQRISTRAMVNLMMNVRNAARTVEVDDRRRKRAVFGVTSSVVFVEGSAEPLMTTETPEVTTQGPDATTEMETTMASEVTTQGPDATTKMETTMASEVTTQGPDATTEMETTMAPEVTTQGPDPTTKMETTMAPEVTTAVTESTTEVTTQGTTLPPILVARINYAVSLIGRIFQRRNRRLQRSLSRLNRFIVRYQRLIGENTDALNNLPLLVRDVLFSPFQRRIRLRQIFRALRLRLANNTITSSQVTASPETETGVTFTLVSTSRKRRQAESQEVEDEDLVGDLEDLKELEKEVQEALEEIEKPEV